jgi:hypothetical protein
LLLQDRNHTLYLILQLFNTDGRNLLQQEFLKVARWWSIKYVMSGARKMSLAYLHAVWICCRVEWPSNGLWNYRLDNSFGGKRWFRPPKQSVAN